MTETVVEGLASLLRDLPLCPSPFQHWVDVGMLRPRIAKHAGLRLFNEG